MIDTLKNIDVKKLIPQKSPFVMVDSLLHFGETTLKSGLTVTEDNLFTENNIFTESGLIEHMAQSVALHTGCEYFLKNETAPTGYIGSIKTVTIKKLPKLNDVLQTEITVLQEFMGVTLVDISVCLNNEEIANGQMKTVIADS